MFYQIPVPSMFGQSENGPQPFHALNGIEQTRINLSIHGGAERDSEQQDDPTVSLRVSR